MARLFIIIVGCLIATQLVATQEQHSGPQQERGIYAIDDIEEEDPFGELTDVKDVVAAIKLQVKGIIEEVLLHILDYSKGTLKNLKVKLLKKLAKWTLSDVFHAVFDGVAELIEGESAAVVEVVDNYKKPMTHVTEYQHHPQEYKPVHARPHNFYHSILGLTRTRDSAF